MQLSPFEAINLGLVKSFSDSSLLDTTYLGKSSIDLHVRTIISKNDDGNVATSDSHKLKPQEMVSLVSSEIIDVRPGYVAYVFLKNRLSQKGMLALNTGIVDSGFKGPLSTLVTNFSTKEFDIDSEQEFFRVVFHKLENFDEKNIKAVKPRVYDYYTYLKYKIEDISRLPKYFLNRDLLKTQIAEEVASKAAEIKLGKAAIWLSVSLALITIIAPITISKYELLVTEKQKALELKIEVLTKRIEYLERVGTKD